MPEKKVKFLLSSDTLSWYWLDVIFQVAKDIGFDWIDLALWKNFDAWNISYVEKLVKTYKMPISVIQVSENVNLKEMNHAVDLARVLHSEVININAPSILNVKSYKFISWKLSSYKAQNKMIKFAIINPPKSTLFVLPIPKYYFTNVVDIIKKYKSFLSLDISNMEEMVLETNFIKKMPNFLPHMSVVYLSDKGKSWDWHMPLWDWVLKLPSLLKKFKQHEYEWYFSLKLNLDKKDLADLDKIYQILKKCKSNYKENFEELIIK